MATKSQSLRVIRFGVFGLNLQSGELSKHGVKLKLQEAAP
jgi:hypothetical protein